MKPAAGDPADGDLGERPPDAADLFPADRLPLVDTYARLLATDGVVRGLIGPREVPRLWERHLLNSALLAPELPAEATVADVGSGAGLPGLVLAIARPDIRVTLVEPLLRRTTFLQEVVDRLDLSRVEVWRGRAEALHGERRFDVVTARAVAPLERLLRWCMPLVAPDGVLAAMKGSAAEQEVRDACGTLDALGCAPPSLVVAPTRGADDPQTRIVRVTWADPARVSWPPSGVQVKARTGKRGPSRRPKRRSR